MRGIIKFADYRELKILSFYINTVKLRYIEVAKYCKKTFDKSKVKTFETFETFDKSIVTEVIQIILLVIGTKKI